MVKAKNPQADFATGKEVNMAEPEEPVRQQWEEMLIEDYGYAKAQLDIRVAIPMGSAIEEADIVVFRTAHSHERDPGKDIIGIIECKKPGAKDGVAQLKSYMAATSAEWGAWTNGEEAQYFCKDGNQVLEGPGIPYRGLTVADIGTSESKSALRPFTRAALNIRLHALLQYLYTHANISRSERLGTEMIKILFAKLWDEQTHVSKPPRFFATLSDTDDSVAQQIKELFEEVRDNFTGQNLFATHEEIELDDKAIRRVVIDLQERSLMRTDSDVVGDAFEIFSERHFKGEKDQFFTPRSVIRVAVKLVDPDDDQTVLDPACGSGGFLLCAMKHVWRKQEAAKMFEGDALAEQKRSFASRNLFGIDKEADLVKIARIHMSIAGDGQSQVFHHDSLVPPAKFIGPTRNVLVDDDKELTQFDIVFTNPPFGKKVKVSAEDCGYFELGRKWRQSGKSREWVPTTQATAREPHLLFV